MTYVLTATDAPWIAAEVRSALERADTTVRVVAAGQHVRPAVEDELPDLVVLDLQIGNMGGMAACLDLRLESGAGRLPRIPVLMLLDRSADVFLARTADSDGWLIKPLDAYRLRAAADELLAGGTWFEQPDGSVLTSAGEAGTPAGSRSVGAAGDEAADDTDSAAASRPADDDPLAMTAEASDRP
jgi:DNA-binding response OmpR family regulator